MNEQANLSEAFDETDEGFEEAAEATDAKQEDTPQRASGQTTGPAEIPDENLSVESGVPIPPVTRRKYPFHKMKPGDSFEVKADPRLVTEHGETTALQRLRSSLSSSATSYAKRNPKFKLVVRKTGPRTLRCWAVESEGSE